MYSQSVNISRIFGQRNHENEIQNLKDVTKYANIFITCVFNKLDLHPYAGNEYNTLNIIFQDIGKDRKGEGDKVPLGDIATHKNHPYQSDEKLKDKTYLHDIKIDKQYPQKSDKVLKNKTHPHYKTPTDKICSHESGEKVEVFYQQNWRTPRVYTYITLI